MLHVSDRLKNSYASIFQAMAPHSPITEVPQTADIWVRDFMPIRNTKDKWTLFRYYPRYLQNPTYKDLISDNQQICQSLHIDFQYVELIVDGGSVVYKGNTYFISDRVLKDNRNLSKSHIKALLENALETDRVIFLPEAKNDFTGHLDGVLTFINQDTILLNDYREQEYKTQISQVLLENGFQIELLPYNPYKNTSYQSAAGIYVNYIETIDKLIVPIFQQNEDELAIQQLEALFPHKTVITILCNDLAKEGGLLHCVTWD